MAALWMIYGWFVGDLAGLRLVCGWFVGSFGNLWAAWLVCWWFGWFVGGFEF